MLSFLLMFVIPMMVVIFLMASWQNSVEDSIATSNRLMLEQYKSGVDGQLFAVKRIGDSMAADDKVLFFSNASDPNQYLNDSSSFQTIRELVREMTKMPIVNDSLRSSYLYFGRSGKIISNTVIDAENYYGYTLKSSFDTKQEWLDFLLAGSNGFVMREENGAQALYYIRTVERRGEKTVVVLPFVYDYLQNYQPGLLAEVAAGLTIFGPEGEMLHTTLEGVPFQLSSIGKDGTWTLHTDVGELYLTVSYSQDTGCTYISSAPGDVFLSHLNKLRLYGILVMGAVLLVGVLMSFLLAKRRYTPIHALRSALEGQGSLPSASSGDDFAYLQSLVESLKDEKLSVDERLQRSQRSMEHFVLERLVRGTYATLPAMQEQLLALDISFDSDSFMLTAIRVDGFHDGADEGDRTEDEKFIRYVLSSMLLEQLTAYNAQAVEIEGWVYVLLCVDTDDEPPYTALEESLTEALRMLENHFHVSLSLAASPVVEGLHEIRSAYNTVRDALCVHPQKRSVRIFCWQQEAASAVQPQVIERLGRETHKLVQLMQAGDREGMQAQLDELRQASAGVSGWKLRVVYNTLISDCVQTLFVQLTPDQIKQMNKSLQRYVESSLQDETAAMEELLRQLADMLPDSEDRARGQELAQRADEFIRINYASSYMSIAYVADYLGISAGYASALYRRYIGQAMLDAINLTRISHAKALLASTSTSMNEIADQVGYLNSSTFIRSFKKYEGITPGQYRTTHSA